MKAVSPVIEGLEEYEIKVGENQEDYNTLPMLSGNDGFMVCRFEVTDEDLKNIEQTRSIYIYLLTNGSPVQPIAVQSEHPIPRMQSLIDERKN